MATARRSKGSEIAVVQRPSRALLMHSGFRSVQVLMRTVGSRRSCQRCQHSLTTAVRSEPSQCATHC
jgi:hypothetical protein